ncbi:SET domain-containing protein [Colletotrichum tamarilloi]|uniref:SET domain-containing protein n=1 Tax=Colletotrichum tamarilloi TaxID=1209934 RepID=A0ABQ9QNM0_9PEZI|nr:SET domain-containing protein [Colletotrichum tamarilloi]KAI3535939.1 SET domain-containing protein [Colletotrichum filicis]KAK1479399.1 SET domain-containing protein [Colletotrichum tamarilloi]
MSQPKNWPSGLSYLSAPAHSKLLSQAQRQAIAQKPPDVPDIPAQATVLPSPLVKITPITDAGHPAQGQCGLFATRHLKPGTFVLPYLGTVHPGAGALGAEAGTEKSDYDLWLDREAEVAVDADKGGNEARFINDYRGVGERPNAEFREVWCQRWRQKCMAVWVLPEGKNGRGKGGISKGEEILVSYGKGFWGSRRNEEG